MEHMKLSTLFTIHSIVGIIFGLAYVIAPQESISYYGKQFGEAGIVIARLLGAAFINYGVIAWLARKAEDSKARQAIILGFFISLVIAFIISLVTMLTGRWSAINWSTVAIYFLLSLGYGYFQFFKKDSS
jgi:uncharacterized PurR-regulated membrane protein YhhQ (DUF165 family)